MQILREAILRLEPRCDLLHDCLDFGRFAEVVVTSDGWFLGRAPGDVGCNAFLGRPSAAAIARTRQLVERLDDGLQTELIRALETRGIPPVLLGLLPAPASQKETA